MFGIPRAQLFSIFNRVAFTLRRCPRLVLLSFLSSRRRAGPRYLEADGNRFGSHQRLPAHDPGPPSLGPRRTAGPAQPRRQRPHPRRRLVGTSSVGCPGPAGRRAGAASARSRRRRQSTGSGDAGRSFIGVSQDAATENRPEAGGRRPGVGNGENARHDFLFSSRRIPVFRLFLPGFVAAPREEGIPGGSLKGRSSHSHASHSSSRSREWELIFCCSRCVLRTTIAAPDILAKGRAGSMRTRFSLQFDKRRPQE